MARFSVLFSLLVLLSACGGSHSSTPSPNPTINNLSGVFAGAGCALASGAAGSTLTLRFNFTDGDGDLAGGQAQLTETFLPSGTSFDNVVPLPSAGVTLTGVTSGTVEVRRCIRFGTQTRLRESIAVVDNAGQSSNVLTVEVARPAGAPETSADSSTQPASQSLGG